jgi:hypothetical protein
VLSAYAYRWSPAQLGPAAQSVGRRRPYFTPPSQQDQRHIFDCIGPDEGHFGRFPAIVAFGAGAG